MKLSSPSFGVLSGFCTFMGLGPHLLALVLLLVTGISPPVISLIIFTIAAKFFAEWLFWTKSSERMNEEKRLGNWRVITNREVLSHPNAWIALIMMFGDALLEAALISMALKTAISPALILFTFLGCQALSAPIQGAVSDYFSQKKSLLFAVVISIAAISAAGDVSLDGSPKQSSKYSLINLLCLYPFTPGVQMILILCAKGALGNITVIARSAIAEVVKFKATDATEAQ